jgi:hypothetical protein
MVETRTFPGFASVGAFGGYVRFVLGHRTRVRRVALVTDSMLAPVARFMASQVMGIEMRHYPFARRAAALDWLRVGSVAA